MIVITNPDFVYRPLATETKKITGTIWRRNFKRKIDELKSLQPTVFFMNLISSDVKLTA